MEAFERFVDVAGHGQIAGAFLIVPFHGDTAEELGIPIDCDRIMFATSGDEVIGVVFADVAGEEIVDDKAEPNLACRVSEEARRKLAFVVLFVADAMDESSIGDLASLFESVHTTADFAVDVSVVGDEIHEAVLVDDTLWND